MSSLRVAGAQLNLTVGDLEANVSRIRESMERAEDAGADVLLLPELAVPGYPPEDLLLRPRFIDDNIEALETVAAVSGETVVVVGFVDRVDDRLHRADAQDRMITNAAAVLRRGAVVGIYHKVLLPNYGVFDEARYFSRGTDPARCWSLGELTFGVSVCEDIWSVDGPPAMQAKAGASILLNINGSPYHRDKGVQRAALLAGEARRSGVPVVYLNLVGGQDELVFDGESMIFDANGGLVYRSPQFAEDEFVVDVSLPSPAGSRAISPSPAIGVGDRADRTLPPVAPLVPAPRLDESEEIYTALVTGLRDYVHKNGFREVVIGLSGGIDSALTCAIAVDALGPEAVWGISMPSRFSSQGSIDDSQDLATRLGCRFDVIALDAIFSEYLAALEPAFAGTAPGVAEENLQARIRGALLMALSNKFGGMVVATGNKSELAVGYATLYGDMAGGYAVLKDVFKTLVYDLARWRNRDQEVIPRAIIDKPPSAELRPDQLDTDSLPPYDVLDAILYRYVELDQSEEKVAADGMDPDLVHRVARMVDRNEYKRRQAAPGVRITEKAFGKDRRLPITNGYR